MRLFYQHVVRYALRHKVLAAVNVLSVALGAAVFLAVQIVNQSATRAFEAGVDVVAGRAQLEARGRIPVQLWLALKKVPGCTAATPLAEGLVTLPDYEGEYLHLLGVDPFTNKPFQAFKVSNFDADSWFGDPSAVAITRKFAERHHLGPGDAIRVQVGEREVTLRVKFTIEADDADSHFAVMDIGWAQEVLGQSDFLSAVLFRLDDPRHPEAAIAALRRLLPKDVVVRSPEQRSAQIAFLLAGFQLNLTALSLISLLVGTFLIYNTITASAVRRRTEIGILRAVGGSQALVRSLFLGEAALYGAAGSVLGCFLGVLLAQGLVR
ncbi:MAG: ABC transporter permease, partial [Verrucomicrobia bacterium]|nr:ABC transporter permease [Verrucomicrobiota bacterium]